MKKIKPLCCACLCALFLTSCGDSMSQSTNAPSVPTSSPEITTTNGPVSSSTPETIIDDNDSQKQVYGVGDTISTDIWEITIESAEWTKSLTNKIGVNYVSDEGKSYIFIKFAIKNVTDETFNVPASIDLNAYVDGEKILNDVLIGDFDGYAVQVGALSGGKVGKYYTAWQVPDESEKFEFSIFTYDLSFNFSETDFVEIDLSQLKS